MVSLIERQRHRWELTLLSTLHPPTHPPTNPLQQSPPYFGNHAVVKLFDELTRSHLPPLPPSRPSLPAAITSYPGNHVAVKLFGEGATDTLLKMSTGHPKVAS